MAATLSDNLNIAKAPPVGAFVLRRYDRGIRGMHCISTPVTSPFLALSHNIFTSYKGCHLVAFLIFRLRESLLTYPLTQEPASLIPFHHTQHHPNYPEVRL